MASSRRLARRSAAACGLVCLLAATAFAQEESTGSNLGAKETVLRVLQLSQELEKLLATLPPETQETLRGQLMDRLAAPGRVLEEAAEVSPEAVAAQPGAAMPAQPGAAVAAQPGAAVAAQPGAAVAAQPAPIPELDVRPAQPEGEPISAEDTSIEPVPVEHSAIEPPPAPEPTVIAAATAADIESPISTSPAVEPAKARRGCRTVVAFDSDGDDKLTGLDRYWRHFYLWTDVDEDGSVDEKELESPYERGIREIDVGLRSFVRGKGKRKRSLEIQVEGWILLDVGGDGWSGRPRGDDGALAIDASAIREDGGPDLRDQRGRAVEGIRPFEPGWRLIVDGEEIVANCPRA